MKHTLFLLSLIVFNSCYTQSLGEKAEIILYLVEQNFDQRKTKDLLKYGELQYNYAVDYFLDGSIKEIVVEQQKAFFYDLEAMSDIRVRYKMQDGALESVTTNFFDLSVDHLRKKFNQNYGDRRLDETLYFERNYKSYRYIHWEEEIPSITYTLYKSEGFEPIFDQVVKQKQAEFIRRNN